MTEEEQIAQLDLMTQAAAAFNTIYDATFTTASSGTSSGMYMLHTGQAGMEEYKKILNDLIKQQAHISIEPNEIVIPKRTSSIV